MKFFKSWCAALMLTCSGAALSSPVQVQEFYAPSIGDFFLTSSFAESDALNSGAYGDWGAIETFAGFDSPVNAGYDGEATPVCRIYTGGAHFFSASPSECADVYASNPDFVLENWAAFYIYLPDAAGQCSFGETPVFRLWDGISYSRFYTTRLYERDYLLANGWVSEGYGADGVAMCSPGL